MKKRFLKEPPMGWNSWDCYGAGVCEETLIANAEYMRDNLKAFGWEYVVCDIQWYEPKARGNNYNNFTELCMDEYSRLIPAWNRFPSAANGKGFKPIAEKIHNMGLKFGIHIMRGIPRQAVHSNTPIKCENITSRSIAQQFSLCPWNTDMYGVNADKKGAQEYYDSLFELYASWGVDFVKCDDIANTEFKPQEPYSANREIELIRNAIDKCGRDIVLSLSPGPAPISEHKHLAENANMWRICGDFWDNWSRLADMFPLCREWAPYTKTGAYPDCDMIPFGLLCVDEEYMGEKGILSRFTADEQITLMTLWCIFRSPLFIGCELRACDEFTLSLFCNREVIRMNKTACNARETANDKSGLIIWEADGECCRYKAFFNTSDSVLSVKELLTENADEKIAFDMWSGEKAELKHGEADFKINPHGARLFEIAR